MQPTGAEARPTESEMDSRGKDLDRADVQRVLAGDVDAFEGIVHRWQGPLVNLAYRYCRNRGRAEEMAQEAFLRAFRFLDRWKDSAAFSTWLFALAINVYRSHLRRLRPVEVELEPDRDAGGAQDPEDRAESEQTARLVRRTVARLPERYRDAIVLAYFHGLDVRQAADCLGVPEGTIKARLHRGRELLRRRLASLLATPGEMETT